MWIAWLSRENKFAFLYGCAARSLRAAGWHNDRSIDLPDGQLIIGQYLVAEDVFDTFRHTLDWGTVSFDALLDRTTPPSKVAAKRVVIQDCLGHAGSRAALYYTLPDVPALIGPAEQALERVLSILQAELNLPFKGHYATRLGNFEYSISIFGSTDRNPFSSRSNATCQRIAPGPKPWKSAARPPSPAYPILRIRRARER